MLFGNAEMPIERVCGCSISTARLRLSLRWGAFGCRLARWLALARLPTRAATLNLHAPQGLLNVHATSFPRRFAAGRAVGLEAHVELGKDLQTKVTQQLKGRAGTVA